MVNVASVVLVAAVLVLPALAPVPVYGQTVVRIGYSGGGVAKNLHKLIERAGLWKKRGLDVRPILFHQRRDDGAGDGGWRH